MLVVASLLATMLTGCSLDDRFVYFPAPWQAGDWAARSGLPIEDVFFEAEDGVRLHGWWISAPDSRAALLWCHGNAGNVINRLDVLAAWHARGVSSFIFDYRGYGRSRGRPSEPGLYRDAEAADDLLRGRLGVAAERIVLYGQSLGSAVAGELARRRPAAGLILEAPFPSVAAVASMTYGPLPVHWLLRARYDLAARLREVRLPVLVIHGGQDRIIPFGLGQRVFEAANEPKEFYRIEGADHNDIAAAGGAAYFDRLLAFIRRVTPEPAAPPGA